MNHATRLALTIAAFFLLVVCAVGANLFLTRYAIDHSQTRWCDTLTLLTSHPILKPSNPAANPSRYQNYLFYIDLVKLKNDYGCPH